MLARIAAVDIWDATGIQGMRSTRSISLPQLLPGREQLEVADRLLLMPDLIAHRLSGGAHRSVEVTNGSTTQMMTPGGRAWNVDLLDRAGLPSHFLGPTVASSTRIGVRNGVPSTRPARMTPQARSRPFRRGDKRGLSHYSLARVCSRVCRVSADIRAMSRASYSRRTLVGTSVRTARRRLDGTLA